MCFLLLLTSCLVILSLQIYQVTDSMLMNAKFVYPENTPTTKEAYYYRTIFEKFFPKVGQHSVLPLCFKRSIARTKQSIFKASFLLSSLAFVPNKRS